MSKLQISELMQKMLAEFPVAPLKPGDIIPATVTEIRPNGVMVSIGVKAETLIPAAEFLDMGDVNVGSAIDVYIEKLESKEGCPVLSYDRAQQKKNWEDILSKCQEGAIVPGRVKGKTKGGLLVNVGVDAFLPSSQIDVQQPKNLEQYIGQTFDFKVIKINFDRKNIIISRRELIEEQRQEKRRTLLSEIQKGDVRRGVVKNITDYGAFVDLDGLDGLLHITDMSWGRVSHPSEVVKQGEEIGVIILDIDAERERVSLGLKQLIDNPWDKIETKYPIKARVKGKVVNLVPYGAFVELEEGVEGLVHITQLSWTKRINKPSEVLKVGQEIEAEVLGIQKAEQRISLGVRQLDENPWDMVRHNYPVGARVRGKVRNLTPYGAFVELEAGIDGMVHVSDVSWTRKLVHPGEALKKGDEVEAVVLEIDPDQQRIALGLKQLTLDPWSVIEKYFKIGDLVTGKVTKVTNYGAFVELPNDIDGLVHISQLREDHTERVKDAVQVGQEVSARVIKIDRNERRVGLSIKAASYDADQLAAEMAAHDRLRADQELTSLGDLFDGAGR
jgi:small subunit ribosomal protein S1